jgi:hypothetical protein
LHTLTWERTGLGKIARWGGQALRQVQMSDVVEILIGAESNVIRRFGGDGANPSLCLSLLLAQPDQSDSSAPRDSLDVQCDDDETFGRWIAACHGLLALHTDVCEDGAALREQRRSLALSRAAPQLHSEMLAREEEVQEVLRREAEAEASRQYETSRAKAEAEDRRRCSPHCALIPSPRVQAAPRATPLAALASSAAQRRQAAPDAWPVHPADLKRGCATRPQRRREMSLKLNGNLPSSRPSQASWKQPHIGRVGASASAGCLQACQNRLRRVFRVRWPRPQRP